MSIEDIDFLKKNSIKEDYLFIVDSKNRDYLRFPDPNYYEVLLNVPLKNVIGINVMDASIPRTMYSVDKYNNSFSFYISNNSTDPLVANGLDPLNTNMNIFTKIDLNPGNYTIQTFLLNFNNLMTAKAQEDPINISSPIQIINFSNPPELTNKITFTCKKPFILNMYDSTLAETLGFSLNIKKEDDNIKYKYISGYEGNEKFLRFYHSYFNSKTGNYEITSPGIVFFIGEKYIVLRSPEIEEHAYGSLAYTNYNLGIVKFKVNSVGFNDEKLEMTRLPIREFHPIGKLSKLTFKFETSNGFPYDFKGVNHIITYLITYYRPLLSIKNEFKPILNPNYKNNFNDYRYINEEQELSDEEDKDEYSRDKLFDVYRRNELLYKSKIEEEEDDEEEEEDDNYNH
jgi:hypothetical protein